MVWRATRWRVRSSGDAVSDVLVIGGGIVGAAITERLVRDGCTATLVERGGIGREASYAAGGLLTPVHPWNYPASMLQLDAESLGLWPDLVERLRRETGVDVELRRTGLLTLIVTDDDEAEADRRVAWKRERGERVERLSASEAGDLEPSLHPETRGALYLPDLAQVRNHRVAPALAAAAAKAGADVREQTTVLGLLRENGRVVGARTTAGDLRAEHVVLAAGAWSGGLLGDRAPPAARTRPARGQILLLRARPGELQHMVLAGDQYLVPRADGHVLAGSTVEDVGFDRQVTVSGLRRIAASIERMAPGLASAPVETAWAGLRPDTPDHLPVLGHVEPGLIAATGHYRSGIMLAPVTAEIVRELVAGEGRRDLSPFDPHRASG